MNLYQLDEIIISSPMSQEKRIQYLQIFLDKAFLKGIDRGTILENIRQEKIRKIHESRLNVKFKKLLDDISDLINIAENRVYREKYKGRYNYYKSKKLDKRNLPVDKDTFKISELF